MSTIPPILVKLQADVSGLKTGLAQAEQGIKNIDGHVKTASSGMSNFVTQLKSVGAAMGVAFAGAQIAKFAKDTVMAASTMNESVSKVNVVFGQSAETVFKFGKTAATSMGMSNQAAIEAAGTYGNLFQAFGIGQGKATEMSTTLVKLAADLGSFNNTSTEEAINALRSGLSGETEPLKRYGVALNETTLKAKAMAMGFGEIKGAMDPAIKAQVTYALVLEQTKLAQGDYERTASGTANTMKTLGAQFADVKVVIGNLLLPAFNMLLNVLKVIIPILKSMATFVNNNTESIKAFAFILAVAGTAFLAYKTIMVGVKVAQQAYVVVTTLMKGAQLATIASTNGMAASMLVLNAVMKKNVIGIVITAVAALAAGFVYLWNHSEAFRKIIILAMQTAINAVAKFLSAVGTLVDKLSGIPLIGKKFQGMANDIKIAASRLEDFSNGLDKLNAKKSVNPIQKGTYLSGSGTVIDTTPTTTSAIAEAKKKAESELKANENKLAGLYKQLASLEEKKAKLQAQYDKNVVERRTKYEEDVVKAKESANKRLLELEKAYNKQIEDSQKAAAQKRREIIQQSIDSLRDVFKSASALDVGKMFADLLKGEDPTQATVGNLVEKFRKQLADIQQLAKNATALGNAGFNQTFIEQVIGQGTEVGNKLATEILNAAPGTINELQTLYGQIQDTSANGVDVLGNQMYEGMGLATEALKKAYEQVGLDLTENLAQYAKDFGESSAQVKSDLVETLVELKKELDKDLAAMQDSFHIAMAEINSEIQSVIKSIRELIALMASLSGLGGGGGGKSGGGGGGSVKASPVVTNFNGGSFRMGEAKSMINVNISNTNTQSDGQTAASVLTAIKYGQVIEIGQGRL